MIVDSEASVRRTARDRDDTSSRIDEAWPPADRPVANIVIEDDLPCIVASNAQVYRRARGLGERRLASDLTGRLPGARASRRISGYGDRAHAGIIDADRDTQSGIGTRKSGYRLAVVDIGRRSPCWVSGEGISGNGRAPVRV